MNVAQPRRKSERISCTEWSAPSSRISVHRHDQRTVVNLATSKNARPSHVSNKFSCMPQLGGVPSAVPQHRHTAHDTALTAQPVRTGGKTTSRPYRAQNTANCLALKKKHARTQKCVPSAGNLRTTMRSCQHMRTSRVALHPMHKKKALWLTQNERPCQVDTHC